MQWQKEFLYSVYVESVTYDSSQKDNKGGKVDFTVKGVSIIGNVKIRVKEPGGYSSCFGK